jgi:hypothetical protein
VDGTKQAIPQSLPKLATGIEEFDDLNRMAVCDNAVGNERVDGSAIAAGIRQVIAGESGLFSHEYACDSPVGQCGLY